MERPAWQQPRNTWGIAFDSKVSIAFEDRLARKLGRNSKVLGVHIDAMPESPRIRITVDLLASISVWLALTALGDFGFQHVRIYDGDTTILVSPFAIATYSVQHLPSELRKAGDGTDRPYLGFQSAGWSPFFCLQLANLECIHNVVSV